MLTVLTVTYLLAGLCFGSLANRLIDYYKGGEAAVTSLRRCLGGARSGILELIPFFGRIICRKRRGGEKVSVRYPLVEGVCAILFAGMAVYSGSWVSSVFLCALAFVLLCVSCIDIYSREIPDTLLLFGASAGAVWIIASRFAPLGSPDWHNALLGAVAGALPLYAVDFATIRFAGKDAFGYGDMKLMAVAGLFLGWKPALTALLLAITAGGVYGAVLLCSRRASKGYYMAFAPFLSIGVLAALWFGHIAA